MKPIIASLTILALSFLASSAASAQSSTTYKLDIFPLECSYDTVALGETIAKQLTPDNCTPAKPDIIPEDPTPSAPPINSPANTPASPLTPNELPTSPLSPSPPNSPPNGASPEPAQPTPPRRSDKSHLEKQTPVEALLLAGIMTLSTAGLIFLVRAKKHDDDASSHDR